MNKIKIVLYPLLTFALLVVLSWVLVHLLTVFGVFLAIAYPIWWMISPKQTICVACRSKKDGEKCPFCHEVVHKSDGMSPKTFSSAIINGIIILLFSVLSIGVVFFESQLLFRFGFSSPTRSVSFSVPSQQEHSLGEIFPMQVKISGISEAINAVRFDFSYNPSQLEVVDISTKDSFANIFIQKQIDNKAGFVRFAGGLANPGFSGSQGVFATVYLRGLKTGIATLTFLPTSSVLANNGRGDNLLADFGSASYLIVASMPSQNPKLKQNGTTLETNNVLGASTESARTQMIFYDERDVLGANTSVNPPEVKKDNKLNPLNLLCNFDKFILNIWRKIL